MAATGLKQLLEAGVHFGHQTSRWNPKMKPYILTARNGIHIIDLDRTVKLLEETCNWITRTVADGGNILFVGTKKQAQAIIEEEAKRAGQHYVNHRWMGGMLTNFTSIQQRFRRMKELRDMQVNGAFEQMSKKDAAKLEDELERLERNFGGIAELKRLPSAIYVVDPRKEHIAVTEARKLRIPIVAITDSNCDPEQIDHVIPGNDDAIRAVRLITARLADACLLGRAASSPNGVAEAAAAAVPEYLAGVDEADIPSADAAVEDEAKPAPIVAEEEFTKELDLIEDQDRIK